MGIQRGADETVATGRVEVSSRDPKGRNPRIRHKGGAGHWDTGAVPLVDRPVLPTGRTMMVNTGPGKHFFQVF